MSSAGGEAIRPPSLLAPAALAAAAVAAALLVHGYAWELGAENQPLQIPVIQRLGDPALFPGDPAVEALAKFRSALFPAAAALARWVPIESQYFALHLLSLAAAAAAMGALAHLLSGSRPAAGLAAFLLLASPIARPTPLGHDTTVASWVTPTTVSFPVLLAALHQLIRGRPGTAGIAAGLAANLNPVMAGLFLIVALPVALSEARGRRARAAVRLASGFAILALPSLLALPDGALVGGRGLDFLELLRRYFPYHFFLGSQPPGVFLRLAILVAAAVAGFRALPESEPVRRARRILVAVTFAIGAGGFFADIVPVAAVTQLHLLRADRWFLVMLFAAGAAAVAREVGSGVGSGVGSSGSSERWSLAGALALAAGLARASYPLLAWGALILLAFATGRGRARPLTVGLAMAAGVFSVIRAWDRGYELSVAFTAVLAAAALAVPAIARPRGVRLAALATVIAVALLELATANGTLGPRGIRFARPVFPPEWREIQDWAARDTPKAARFLTPPRWAGFRVYARRSTAVEWKDGAAMLWEPSFGPPWWERLVAVERAIASRNAAELRAAARRYQAGWIVVPAEEAPPGMTPVHENRRFKVFAVDEGPGGARR